MVPSAHYSSLARGPFLLEGASSILAIIALVVFGIPDAHCSLVSSDASNGTARLAVHLPLSKSGWVKMMIKDSVRYKIHSPEADEEFSKLLPEDGHIVHVGGEQTRSTIAMFHQLRCLDIIRRDYLKRLGASPLTRHCLNYLRQSILCHTDDRLESVRSPVGPRIVSFSFDYVCNDWSAVYEAVEENQRLYRGRGKQKRSVEALIYQTGHV